jgi:hypothetical protein
MIGIRTIFFVEQTMIILRTAEKERERGIEEREREREE